MRRQAVRPKEPPMKSPEATRGPKSPQESPGGQIKPTETPGERATPKREIVMKNGVRDTKWSLCRKAEKQSWKRGEDTTLADFGALGKHVEKAIDDQNLDLVQRVPDGLVDGV